MMRDFDKIDELSREEERGQGGDEELAVMRAVHHGCEKYHEWYLRDSLWLASAIERARVDTANNTCNGAIVLTHHAPLTKPEVVHSSSREMRGHIYGCEGTNNLYASMVAFDNPCVRAWAYGHTHKCFSMRCSTTKCSFACRTGL